MSRWNDRDRSEESRRREYENDVFYEAWRRGLNPDRATDCAMDCYFDHREPEQCVDDYAAALRRRYEQEQLADQEGASHEPQSTGYCQMGPEYHDAAAKLAEFAETAPGRLPSRIEAAIAVVKESLTTGGGGVAAHPAVRGGISE